MNPALHDTALTAAPLIIIAVVTLVLAKWAIRPWALLVGILIGIALTGTLAGPYIHGYLPHISGGFLH